MESPVDVTKFPRLWALSLAAAACGYEDIRTVLSAGFRYVGVTGGAEHVVRDPLGRVWQVDLVLRRARICVGYAPKIKPS